MYCPPNCQVDQIESQTHYRMPICACLLTIFILLALKAGVRMCLLFFHSSPLEENTLSYTLPSTRVTRGPRCICKSKEYKETNTKLCSKLMKNGKNEVWDAYVQISVGLLKVHPLKFG